MERVLLLMLDILNIKDHYDSTPFLKIISVVTLSDVKHSKFNIRLYSKNENGAPGDYMYNQNIIGIVKKGNKNY